MTAPWKMAFHIQKERVMKLRHSIIAAAALAACVVLGAQAQTSPAMADSAAKQPSGERTLANQDKGMPKSTASSTTRKEVKAQAVSARADGQVAVGEQSTPNQGKKPMKALPKEVVVDVSDENTVAMSDPKKGKLIFKKK